MKKIKYFFVAIAFIGFTNISFAQSEHPGNGEMEHPTSSKTVNKKNFTQAIKSYVKKESADNNGYFIVHDKKQDKDLKLKLIKIHEDKLASLGDNTYFMCSDFKGKNGKTYDIDVFMKGKDVNSLKATKTSVHKVNGKERYTWKKEGDTWKQINVE